MPKRVPPLTDHQIKAAKPRNKPYILTDGLGLFIEVTPVGSKLWRWKYRRPDGRWNRLTFGRYPETTLLMARDKRLEAARLLSSKIDPAAVRDRQRHEAEAREIHRFEPIAREWLEVYQDRWQPNTRTNILHRLESDVFPEVGKIPLVDITHDSWLTVFRKIEARGAREVAHRLCGNCSQIYQYAITRDIVDRDVPGDIRKALKPVQHGSFAAITADELPEFLSELRSNKVCMSRITHIAVELMLLVFIRTSELIETPWTEIDIENEVWTIPWQRMKRGRRRVNPDTTDHVVFLSRQALRLLRELHGITGGGKYLFPNGRDWTRPMSNGAILAALRRMGYRGQMTGHGFRSLAMSTLKERLAVRHEIVDRQLAHSPKDKTERAYDRAMFLDARRQMMQDWADYLDAIL